jgi:hypothetical protein
VDKGDERIFGYTLIFILNESHNILNFIGDNLNANLMIRAEMSHSVLTFK